MMKHLGWVIALLWFFFTGYGTLKDFLKRSGLACVEQMEGNGAI